MINKIICLACWLLTITVLVECLNITEENIRLNETNTDVVFVQMLFRHGDRTPCVTYPNDPYNETIWDKYGGFGQLTQEGIRRHFDFGQDLRRRYAFLNKMYHRDRVHVASTDIDRTLMSASSLLEGLFMPIDFQKWNKDVNWQPIPIHTTDSHSNMLFYDQKCPRRNDLEHIFENSDEFQGVRNFYKQLIDSIKNKTGYGEKMSMRNLYIIADAIKIEKHHGLMLPDWAERNFDLIANSVYWKYHFEYGTQELSRLRSGTVLNEMRNNIVKKVKSKTSLLELSLYSAHDSYVAGLAGLLNITQNFGKPNYASAVILELRKSLENNYFVQIILKNNTETEPITYKPLAMKGCDLMCPLEKFIKLTEPLIVKDIVKECRSSLSIKDLVKSFVVFI